MRTVVLLLILVNIALFGYARLDRAAQSEAARLQDQVDPDRIKLMSPQQVAALGPTKVAALADVCVEWGPFSDADRSRAQADLDPLALGRLLSQRPVADTVYWVNLGPFPTRAAADRRAGELRAQAIDDLSVVDLSRGGQFTVSLGVFRTEAAAAARSETLAARGVLGTRVEPRQQDGGTQAMLVVRDPPQPVVARLKELQTQYAGTDLKVGPCVPGS